MKTNIESMLMTEQDKQIILTAYGFVISILSYGEPTTEGINELYKIKNGDKKVLLEHLKAINSITGDAIKLLGGKKDEL